MGAMLCTVVPEASQQTTGNGPGRLKKIDSGATRNFMSRKFATNHKIPGLPKERPYQLTVVDGTPLNQDERMVKEKTLPLMSQIHGKDLGRITFD